MTIIRWVALPIAVIVGPIIVSAIFTVIYNVGSFLWGESALGYPKEGEIVSIVAIMGTLGRDLLTGFSIPMIAHEIAPSFKKVATIVAAIMGVCFSVSSIVLNMQQEGSFGWVSFGIVVTIAGVVCGTYLVGKKEVYSPNSNMNTLKKDQNSPSSIKRDPEQIAVELAKTESGQEVMEMIDQYVRTNEDPVHVVQQIMAEYPEHAELALKWYRFLTVRSFHAHTDKAED